MLVAGKDAIYLKIVPSNKKELLRDGGIAGVDIDALFKRLAPQLSSAFSRDLSSMIGRQHSCEGEGGSPPMATSRPSSVEAMALRETADRPRLPPHRLAQLRLQSKRMATVDNPPTW